MSRWELPYLSLYRPVLPLQGAEELVGPEDGRVHVLEHEHPWRYDGGRLVQVGSLYLVRTPQRHDAGRQFHFDSAGAEIRTGPRSCLVPCTPQACRRWVEAAIAYATVLDGISAELVAAHHRAGSVPEWRRVAAPLALRNWEKAQQRYERVIREASEAYNPVRREIRLAIDAARDEAAGHARQAAAARRRRAELAQRPVWVWSSRVSKGRRTAHISRHDAPADGSPAPTSPQVNGPLDLPALRQALAVLKPHQLRWDREAITEAERELEGVSFESWWRELFSEDYRTFTSPPPSPRSSFHPPVGGTGTSGTGGYTGGFGGFGGY